MFMRHFVDPLKLYVLFEWPLNTLIIVFLSTNLSNDYNLPILKVLIAIGVHFINTLWILITQDNVF